MDFSVVMTGIYQGAVSLGFPAAVSAVCILVMGPPVAAFGVRMVRRMVG